MTTPDHPDPNIGDPQASTEPERHSDQVVAALDLLTRSEFGRCAVCGTRIDDRRLRLAPDVDRCQRHIATTATGSEGEVA